MDTFLTPTIAGLLMVTGGVPTLFTVYLLRNKRQQPAVLWFQRAMVSGMVWSLSFGLIALVDSPPFRFVLTNIIIVAIPIASISFFIFSYEFTFKRKVPTAVFVLFVPVFVLFVAAWINPGNLVYTMADPHLTDEILIPANEGSIRPLVTVGMGYSLVVMAAGMVFGEMLSTPQRSRRIQAAVILCSTVTVSVLGAIKVLGLVPPYFDPTPIGWTVSGLLFAVSITRYQFLQQSLAPRDHIMAEIPAVVIVLDAESIVTDCNETARELLGVDVGMTRTELAQRNPELGAVIGDSETTVEIHTNGTSRIFDAQSSPLEYGRGTEGTIMILRDITHRKAAQEELEATKERYRRIFQQSSDYVTIVDETETMIDVTQGIKHMLGYEPEEVIGQTMLSDVHPEDKQRVKTAFTEVVANPERNLNVEFRVQAADGSYRWLEGRGSNHLDDPLIDGVLATVRDISQRKEREQELEELTTRLELALEETQTGVWEWDLSTNEVVWDETCERLFGYEPGAFPGRYESFTDRVADGDLSSVEQAVADAIETGDQYQATYSVELPDGEQRWIQSRGVVEYDTEGNATRLLGVQTDITDQKEVEQALEETKERYQRMLKRSSDYVTIVDETETMIDATKGIEHVLGYEPKEVIGNKVLPYIHPEDRKRAFETFAGVLADPGAELNVEYRARTADGSYRWIEGRGSNHLDDPLIEGILVNVRDISTRKQREQELAETTTRLQRKNEQLERLAQIISHDLQTPLSTAEKLTRLLRTDLTDPEPSVDQSLTDLEATHQRLREFADHLPRLARESTDVDERMSCELRVVAEDAWNVVDTAGLELRIDSSCTLEADPNRLQRVFENLFQNTVVHGVKAVEESTQQTTATTVRVGTTAGGIYIEDDGPGIRPEQRDELFEYGMGTGSGSGFGLAIVRTIIEAHGWTITVADSSSGGARFDIETDSEARL